MFACPATDDFFRVRLDHMIDLRHPLAVLSFHMPWEQNEASVAHLFSRKARAAQPMPFWICLAKRPHHPNARTTPGAPACRCAP